MVACRQYFKRNMVIVKIIKQPTIINIKKKQSNPKEAKAEKAKKDFYGTKLPFLFLLIYFKKDLNPSNHKQHKKTTTTKSSH